VATSRRQPSDGRAAGNSRPQGKLVRRLPAVRLAAREELAAAARVVPLLRAARDLARWAGAVGETPNQGSAPGAPGAAVPDCARAAAELDLTIEEAQTAWRVAEATGMLEHAAGAAGPARPDEPARGDGPAQPDHSAGPDDPLANASAEAVLAAWDRALEEILRADDLDGLATALYTVAGPLRMDGLFDAYAAAAGALLGRRGPGDDYTAEVSRALETLADLGVVELGTEEPGGALTVALSPLGTWGIHRRLRAQGWHVPVLGDGAAGGAMSLLRTLASCDAEDGEAEIAAWLAGRSPAEAAAELVAAARHGTPGLRGAAFAVLDRIGAGAAPEVRVALAEPVLRAHAAVWLHEHGEDVEVRPEDRTWLLVDLGAGLLEEADPRDVVAELLPEIPAAEQAEIVAGLWEVRHPGVTGLLTALSEYHPDPAVARAARKAAFKAASPAASTPWHRS